MAKRKPTGPKQHNFRDKLLLNQWLISQFGIDPLAEDKNRPFHKLAEPIRDSRLEGLDKDNLHHFFHALTESELFYNDSHAISREQILVYEENIVRHTQSINAKRHRLVVWKYFQWLSLLFVELYLLRNMSRGKGVGFFEAGNFYPDFILWMIVGNKQYVTFIEPHGLIHEGPASEKVLFYKRIKEIERRFADPDIILNSFILSWTKYPQLRWGAAREELEQNHVLFMTDDQDEYIIKLIAAIREEIVV